MNINEVRNFLLFIANKSQSGGVFTTAQFNLAAQRAQMEFFNAEYKKWKTNMEISDAIRTLITSLAVGVPATGKYKLPTDYIHTTSIRKYFAKDNGKSIEVPVREIQPNELGDLLQSETSMPTKRFPIGAVYSTFIQFYPTDIGNIKFEYFRTPKDPKWGYAIVNNRQVYDAATSQDFEIDNEYHNQIVMNMADYLGINIRENDLINWSKGERQEQDV